MEFSKQSLNKSPTEKLIYNMNKHLNINPFSKKINNKLGIDENKNKEIESDEIKITK